MVRKAELFLLDCATYEDYLDTFVSMEDKRNMRNARICRMLVVLGYRSKSAVYTPKEFKDRKAQIHEELWPTKKSTILYSLFMSPNSKEALLLELSLREILNNQKIISTIIFVRFRRKNGFEVSGYIDFEESIRNANANEPGCTDWIAVFQEKELLRPKPSDLSFFDWHSGFASHNDSDNYKVVNDVRRGLTFMHKGDHKKICVGCSKKVFKNYSRDTFHSECHGHVVLYDHVIRKKI